jgi:hypothetical protein
VSIADGGGGGGGLLGLLGGFFGGGGGTSQTDPGLSAALANRDADAIRAAWGFPAGGVTPPQSPPDVITATPPITPIDTPIRIPTTEIIEAPPSMRGPIQRPIFYDPVVYDPKKAKKRGRGGKGPRIPSAAAVARVLRGAAGGILTGTLGLLWPSELGNSQLFDPKKQPKRVDSVLSNPPRANPVGRATPRMPADVVQPIPMPAMPPIAQQTPLEYVIPTAKKLPESRPAPRASGSTRRPTTPPGGVTSLLPPWLRGIDVTDLLLLAATGRRVPTPTGPRYVDPLTLTQTPIEARPQNPPANTPLTGVRGADVPYISIPGTQYCQPPPKRKKTRKCVERDDCNKCIRYAPI